MTTNKTIVSRDAYHSQESTNPGTIVALMVGLYPYDVLTSTVAPSSEDLTSAFQCVARAMPTHMNTKLGSPAKRGIGSAVRASHENEEE